MARLKTVLTFSLMIAWGACTSSHDTLKSRLEAIGKTDLQDILSELSPKAKGARLGKPYFVVDNYQEFHGDTASVFQAKADLVFFYLDPNLDLCQVRQYRYRTTSGIWDRYDVKLKHIPEKFLAPRP